MLSTSASHSPKLPRGKFGLADAVIVVRVTPKSASERAELDGDVVRLWVNAPPAEGQANEAAIKLLSRLLGVPKSTLTIARGSKSRDKRVLVSGITQERLKELLKEIGK